MKAVSADKKVSEMKTSKMKRLNKKKKNGLITATMKDSTTCRPVMSVNGNTSKNLEESKKVTKTSRPVPSSIHHKHISLPLDNNSYSANWKQFFGSVPKPSSVKVLSHRNPSNSVTTKDGSNLYKKKSQNEKKTKQIWFDGIDKMLIETEPSNTKSLSSSSQNSDNKPKPSTITFVSKEHSAVHNRVTEYIALDCEMVGTGEDGKDNMLARVSLVNQHSVCIYDKFVKPRESITDYRTAVSGITPEKLKNGIEFTIVQKEVSDLISGKILVGHAISNDLKVLFLDHPRKNIRDTSRYKPFRKVFEGKTPSLKNLTKKFLGIEIQEGSHNSVIDAQATMKIFMMHKKEWESVYCKPRNKIWKK